MTSAAGIKKLALRGTDRVHYGAIYSLRNMTTGEYLSVHQTGPSRVRHAAVAEWIDQSGEDWRIVCISTPESIYRDLQGTRALKDPGFNQASGRERLQDTTYDPLTMERQCLGQIGRTDLLPSVSNNVWRQHRPGLPQVRP